MRKRHSYKKREKYADGGPVGGPGENPTDTSFFPDVYPNDQNPYDSIGDTKVDENNPFGPNSDWLGPTDFHAPKEPLYPYADKTIEPDKSSLWPANDYGDPFRNRSNDGTITPEKLQFQRTPDPQMQRIDYKQRISPVKIPKDPDLKTKKQIQQMKAEESGNPLKPTPKPRNSISDGLNKLGEAAPTIADFARYLQGPENAPLFTFNPQLKHYRDTFDPLRRKSMEQQAVDAANARNLSGGSAQSVMANLGQSGVNNFNRQQDISNKAADMQGDIQNSNVDLLNRAGEFNLGQAEKQWDTNQKIHGRWQDMLNKGTEGMSRLASGRRQENQQMEKDRLLEERQNSIMDRQAASEKDRNKQMSENDSYRAALTLLQSPDVAAYTKLAGVNIKDLSSTDHATRMGAIQKLSDYKWSNPQTNPQTSPVPGNPANFAPPTIEKFPFPNTKPTTEEEDEEIRRQLR
jgi:flagellar basal body rod protein FlgC